MSNDDGLHGTAKINLGSEELGPPWVWLKLMR